MKLVVGLGNPGPKYAETRHNVGFQIAERFAARECIELSGRRFSGRFGRGWIDDLEVGVLEPETFMNRSGRSVVEALDVLPVGDPSRDLLVLLDDLDLPCGRIRIRPRGSSGGHRGLEDLIQRLGGAEFPRLRFGIGRPTGDDPVEYVLDGFSDEERVRIPGAIDRAAEAVGVALRESVEVAMARYNGELPPSEDRGGACE